MIVFRLLCIMHMIYIPWEKFIRVFGFLITRNHVIQWYILLKWSYYFLTFKFCRSYPLLLTIVRRQFLLNLTMTIPFCRSTKGMKNHKNFLFFLNCSTLCGTESGLVIINKLNTSHNFWRLTKWLSETSKIFFFLFL